MLVNTAEVGQALCQVWRSPSSCAFIPRIAASMLSPTSVALRPTDFNERDMTHFGWLRHAAAKSRSSVSHSGRSSS